MIKNPIASTFIFLCFSLHLYSCKSRDIESSSEVNQDKIYFDYRIWGDEETDYITVKLQYRFGGPTGTTLLLEEPAGVMLDGVKIKPDSSRMTGAYYEMIIDTDEFAGNHRIVYTDLNGKTYKEEFSFYPVTLKKEIPAELKRGELVFELNGLDSVDDVRVVMHNTAADSRGINRVEKVRNGNVLISKEELENVLSGPVQLELYKETDKSLKETTPEGGKLSITYGLKRQFVLKD